VTTVQSLPHRRGISLRLVRSVLLIIALLLLWPAPAHPAQPRVAPPCGGAVGPSYAQPGADPTLLIVRHHPASKQWRPPSCTGWTGRGFRLLLGLAGAFHFSGTAEDLLARFGEVSSLTSIKFWSSAGRVWKRLITDASALDGPHLKGRRPDFTLAELRSGEPLYFLQDDTRTSGSVIYRMRVLESGPDRLVVAVENVTPIRAFLVTLFHPGDLQSVYFMDRLEPGTWGLYTLLRAGRGASAFSSGHENSYASRAIAFYRHLAGIPTDRRPPLLQASN
jgi:hypothetical protein